MYYIPSIHNSRLRWSRGSVLAFSTQVCGFKHGRSRRIFRAKKILSTPSFGGEVKPWVPCRRFAVRKRSLNLRGNRNLGKNYYRTSFSPTVPPFAARISRAVADGGIWRLKWERLKAGESSGKLPPRLVQDAVCQSHTGDMTGLWFLPRPSRLNTNESLQNNIRVSVQ